MPGGYRCTHGHAWTPGNGSRATACPICGDTSFVVEETPVAVVVGAGEEHISGGQEATQALPIPGAAPATDHAVTIEFAPDSTNGSSRSGGEPPSFSSMVVLPPRGVTDSASSGTSSIVQFGSADSVSSAEFAPPVVPGYEIEHEVGRGGMGVVYKARQVSLNRPVALKMILAGSHAGPTERERFKREAESVAALQHPHIVQIFDIGEAEGHPYLALEFVEGGSLAYHLSGEPWPAKQAAELVEILARTMHFAHDAGIVHRDLKPGNVLLVAKSDGKNAKKSEHTGSFPAEIDIHSTTVSPKVTDFGLAKRLDETFAGDGGTRTGAVMGTPSYIAPEQASGKSRDIGPSTDVYSLGAILYELLTGRPPFRGETPLDTVLQVLHDDPVAPKRLHPLVPRDLETICLKCLAKQPAKRYASAQVLADDLRRFLNGEPIKARPLSAWGRGLKWARRHPALTVLLAMTIFATIALVTVLSVSYARVHDAVLAKEKEAQMALEARELAEIAKQQAEQLAKEKDDAAAAAIRVAKERERERDQARRAAFALQLAQVAIICERDPLRAAELLEDEARCPVDLRDFTWHYLRRLCQRDDRAYLDHHPDDPLRAAAFSPTGEFVATAGDAGTIRVWDPRTGRTWLTLTGHDGAIHCIAFSPDGGIIASAGADGTVRLWVLPVEVLNRARELMAAIPSQVRFLLTPLTSTVNLKPTLTLHEAHAGEAHCVTFSPDGRSLISGGQDGILRWWELTGWRPAPVDVAAFGGPLAIAYSVERNAMAPDARPVWPVREIPAHTRGVLCLAFAQNGKYLVSGGSDRMAKVWAGDGTKLVRMLPEHADAVRAVAITPDGGTIATASNPATGNQPPTVRLFNTQSWRERRLFGHTKSIYALAISDDGQLLASAGFDKTVRLWDLDDGRERGHLVGHTQQVNAVAFSPDRRTVVSAGMDGAAYLWQTSARTHEPDDCLRFSNDSFGKPTAQGLTAGAIGGGGRIFVTAEELGRARIMSAIDQGPLAISELTSTPWLLKSPGRTAVSSADGRLGIVAVDSRLLIWRLPSEAAASWLPLRTRPTPLRPIELLTPLPVHSLAIDPTGRWIATADADGVRLYDLRDIPVRSETPINLNGGRRVLEIEGARELKFHPSRDWLAVAIGSGVRIVTLQGTTLADLPRAHNRSVNSSEVRPTIDALAFDQPGDRLATGDASGHIMLWSVDALGGLTQLGDPFSGHTGAVYALAFSPDGLALASGGDDRAVILWDPVARRERLALTGHADRVLDLVFNSTGTMLASISRDGAVKRWRADVRPNVDAAPHLPDMIPNK